VAGILKPESGDAAGAAAGTADALGVVVSTPDVAEQVEVVKAKLFALRKRRQNAAVRAKVTLAESELDAFVNTPVSGGRDPFEWLPDELVVMIMARLSPETLYSRTCECVSHRWARLVKSAPVQQSKRAAKWAAYEVGAIEPRYLVWPTEDVISLAIGPNGRLYSASWGQNISVWGPDRYYHIDLLHLDNAEHGIVGVFALTVGIDGRIYSGQAVDTSVRVWNSSDAEDVGAFNASTLEGHTGAVFSLTVGLDGKIYSGSSDKTIRVWSGGLEGTHLHTLEGHTGAIFALAVGKNSKIYSGSSDHTIRVWSALDGSHIQTLVGHTDVVRALAAGRGLGGKIYSGSYDTTIRVWSGDDGTHLYTLTGHTDCVYALAVGLDGKIFSGSNDNSIRIWSGDDGTHLHTLRWHEYAVMNFAIGLDGSLFSCSIGHNYNLLKW
jgi:hypothetical protein